MANSKDSGDVLIVDGGSAGAVLAARHAEMPAAPPSTLTGNSPRGSDHDDQLRLALGSPTVSIAATRRAPNPVRRALARRLVIGIPAGLIVGRFAWQVVADGLGVSTTPAIPTLALLLTIPAALALVNLIATFPARAAAGTRPAVALRTE